MGAYGGWPRPLGSGASDPPYGGVTQTHPSTTGTQTPYGGVTDDVPTDGRPSAGPPPRPWPTPAFHEPRRTGNPNNTARPGPSRLGRRRPATRGRRRRPPRPTARPTRRPGRPRPFGAGRHATVPAMVATGRREPRADQSPGIEQNPYGTDTYAAPARQGALLGSADGRRHLPPPRPSSCGPSRSPTTDEGGGDSDETETDAREHAPTPMGPRPASDARHIRREHAGAVGVWAERIMLAARVRRRSTVRQVVILLAASPIGAGGTRRRHRHARRPDQTSETRPASARPPRGLVEHPTSSRLVGHHQLELQLVDHRRDHGGTTAQRRHTPRRPGPIPRRTSDVSSKTTPPPTTPTTSAPPCPIIILLTPAPRNGCVSGPDQGTASIRGSSAEARSSRIAPLLDLGFAEAEVLPRLRRCRDREVTQVTQTPRSAGSPPRSCRREHPRSSGPRASMRPGRPALRQRGQSGRPRLRNACVGQPGQRPDHGTSSPNCSPSAA